jgi:hypothetical protein
MATALAMTFSVGFAAAQDAGGSDRLIGDLRGQLSELEYREATLKIELNQLDYELQPENIQRHFNGAGSTRPEELREFRRRQLQAEKDRTLGQLEQLNSERARLEAAIYQAQTEVYQGGFQGAIAVRPQPGRASPLRMLVRVSVTVVGLVAIGAIVIGITARRRRQSG